MNRFVRGGVLVTVTGGALFLPACDEAVAPPLVPSAPQTAHAVIATAPIPDFAPDIFLGIPVPLAQAGILDFTVDWTFTNTYMDVAFGTQPCSFQDLQANRCPFVIFTTGTTPKPRVIVTQPVPVGNYFLYLYSKPYKKAQGTGSDNLESVMLQIGLTVGEGATPRSIPVTPVRLKGPVVSQ